jgi:hypothetical protein
MARVDPMVFQLPEPNLKVLKILQGVFCSALVFSFFLRQGLDM